MWEMAEDVTQDLLTYVQERAGLSTQESMAAVAAVREWLAFRLGNHDASAAAPAPGKGSRLDRPRAS